MNQERCYLFQKIRVLETKAGYFPEAMRELKLEASKNPLANSLPAGTLNPESNVRFFTQSQLINMTRFRNVLRYQMRRSLGQPLVAMNQNASDDTNNNNNNLNSGTTRINKINAEPKISPKRRKKSKRKPAVPPADRPPAAANHTIATGHISPPASSIETNLEGNHSQDLQQSPPPAPVELKIPDNRDSKLITKLVGENFRE